jgi:general secretion pathway protein H
MIRQQRTQVLCDDSGVSLLELLVVLGILSFVLVLAMPSIRAPSRSVEVRTAAHDLVSYLRSARAAAISRGRPVAVTFDVNNLWYRVETGGNPVRLPGDLSMSLTTARDLARDGSSGRMLFYPDGSATGGRIVLSRNKTSATIGVDWLTGTVRMEDRP